MPKIECEYCERKIPEEESYETPNSEIICETCHENDWFECENCGRETHTDDRCILPNGDYACEECHNDLVTECYECGDSLWREDSFHNESNDEFYCRCCYDDIRGEREPSGTVTSDTFKQNKFKRYIGVEIEAERGNWDKLFPYADALGCGLVEDGSLGCDGVELVTPKMNGDKAYHIIREACKGMEASGFEATKSAGIHVHFDFQNETEAQVKKIVAGYLLYEDVFFSMLPMSRQETHFCTPMKRKIADIETRVFGDLKTMIYGRYGVDTSRYSDARYIDLNVHSYYYRGTLEVRSHSATLNPTKIINWIEMHQRFFEWCMTKEMTFYLNHKPNLKTFKNIMGAGLYRYFLKRVAEVNKVSTKKGSGLLRHELRKSKRLKSVNKERRSKTVKDLMEVIKNV